MSNRSIRKARRARRGQRTPAIVAVILILVLLAVLTGVIALGIGFLRSSFSTPGILPGRAVGDGPSENVDYSFGQVLPHWTGEDRITVLLLGIDERSQESGPWRTDTIMLLTLDPVSLQAGVLSIPRDLWVPIPGYNENRINTAHFLGDLYGYEGGGPALAVDTVEYNLGIKIDYYVRANFHAFVTLVDQIGGIDIYVEETISDPTYPDYAYGYDPLYIEAGQHHFDGEMALKYARTRHGSSDFERARHQQQVMEAILNRVTSLDMLPQLAKGAPELFATISESIETDMALDQMLALGNLALEVDKETIRFGVIDEGCTEPWVTPDGAQVLIPLREEMRVVRDYIMLVDVVSEGNASNTNGGILPSPTPELATIAVLNGTSRPGLAGRTADLLTSNGIDVTHVGNAERQDVGSTVVIVYTQKPVTQAKLIATLKLAGTAVVQPSDAASDYDIVVVLGADFAEPSAEN